MCIAALTSVANASDEPQGCGEEQNGRAHDDVESLAQQSDEQAREHQGDHRVRGPNQGYQTHERASVADDCVSDERNRDD